MPKDPSKRKRFVCTAHTICDPICFSASDCASGEVCEDSQCRKPGCADDSECASSGLGFLCVSGRCIAPIPASQVASCEVDPPSVLINAGQDRVLGLVSRDAVGNIIPYFGGDGAVHWNTSTEALSVVRNEVRTATARLSSTADATGVVSARVGNVFCQPASVAAYGPVSAGQFRVVVASSENHTPIDDATVLVNGTTLQHGEQGAYLFQGVETPARITATKEGFNTVTLIDVTTNDAIIYLSPKHAPVKFTDRMTPRSFDNLQDIKGTVHLAINGSAITGSLNDLNLSTFLGDPVETTIDLGASTAKTTLQLPDGIVLGLAENMFKDSYSVSAPPGRRAFWSLGGNIVLSDVLSVVSQASGDVDVGTMLLPLLPVFGRLQAGALPFVEVDSPGTIRLTPELLLRIRTTVKMPELTSIQVLGEEQHLDGTLVIGGLRHPTQGFVPVGLSGGVDGDLNGKVDAVMGGNEGEMALRAAPPPNGLEGSPYEIVALSAQLSQLFGENKGTLPSIIAGVVSEPTTLTFSNNTTSSVTLGTALTPPESIELHLGETPWLRLTDAETVAMYQLDLGSDWTVYFPGTARELDLTGAPIDTTKATLHSMRLNRQGGSDYQGAIRFDGDDLDNLSGVMDAFTIRPLATQEITRTQE